MSRARSYARLRGVYNPTRASSMLGNIILGHPVTAHQSLDNLISRTCLSPCQSPLAHLSSFQTNRSGSFRKEIGTLIVGLNRSYVTRSNQCNEKSKPDGKTKSEGKSKEGAKVEADDVIKEPRSSASGTTGYLQMVADCLKPSGQNTCKAKSTNAEECVQMEDDECEQIETDEVDGMSAEQASFISQLPHRLANRSPVPIRESVPVIQALRDFLLGRKHNSALRSPDVMAPHTRPPPCMPLGPHFKYAENYYCMRDGSREVKPPTIVEGKYIPRIRTTTISDQQLKKICADANSATKSNV